MQGNSKGGRIIIEHSGWFGSESRTYETYRHAEEHEVEAQKHEMQFVSHVHHVSYLIQDRFRPWRKAAVSKVL